MHKHPVALLGISFDNITLDEASQKVLTLINMHGKDKINRYIATINVDFLVKAHTVCWNDIYNVELLDIYRRCHMATCDGKPLIWLSRLLGSPLTERVTGIDLIPKIAAILAQNNKSIYLLGSTEQINKVTGVILEALNPGLRIVGHSSPRIFTEGESLGGCNEQDDLIIEEINKAAPDVLLIAFGNPKQEIWFDRVRSKLSVPVSIGVGGSFEIISGALSRAPAWMQTVGLEWLFRFFQEPRRLWKRYIVDIWKFFWISLPLVLYHTSSRILFYCLHENQGKDQITPPLLFLSRTQTIAMIPLPPLIDEEYCHLVHTHLDETFNQDTVILDFENVRHITLEGFSLLQKIWVRAEANGKELYALHITGDLRLLMKMHRVWDLIKDSVMNSPQQVLRALIQGNSHPDFFDSIQQDDENVIIYFFGRLGKTQNNRAYIEKIAPLLKNKDCLLDFRYCTHIENAGFSFLLKLRKIVHSQSRLLFVRKCSPQIKRLFSLNNVEQLFSSEKAK